MKRNGIIDLTKFIMSIGIVLGHYSYIISQEFVEVEINMTGLMGFCKSILSSAVCVFFVISGYLIANGYTPKIENGTIGFGQFVKGRVKRIFPLFWMSSIIFIALDMLYCALYGHWWAQRSISMSDIYPHFSGTSIWIGGNMSINGPSWYISVLLFCYVLFYISTKQFLGGRGFVHLLWR